MISRKQQVKIKCYIKLSDLILAIKNRDFDQGSFFCLYSKDSMEPLESNSLYFIDEYPQEGAEGEDVFPSDVIKNDLELCYYGEQFIDVINNVISQINEPQVSAFVEALNYYMDNDDFLDIR